ncbi:MAG: small multi-drug export protein [Clostridia bacterium]
MIKILYIILLSATPLLEQRAAIPLGIIIFQMNPFFVFAVSFLGSLLPVPFILFFFTHIFKWLEKLKPFRWFYEYVHRKVNKGSVKVQKLEKWGLIFFVALPLPTTGLWTGSAIAAFLEMDKKKAFLYILAGGFLSAVAITGMSVLFPYLLGY